MSAIPSSRYTNYIKIPHQKSHVNTSVWQTPNNSDKHHVFNMRTANDHDANEQGRFATQHSQNVDVDILTALMCADSLIRELQRNRMVKMSIMGRDLLLTEHYGIPEPASSCAVTQKLQGGGSPAEETVCVYVSGGDIKAGSRWDVKRGSVRTD